MTSQQVTAQEAASILGWSVIPARADKSPFVDWRQYQITRPTTDDLSAWEHQYHPSGWGVVTGHISGITVLDFDGEAGRETMRRLNLQPHRRTPSGGFHVDFVHPGWRVPTLNGKSKIEFRRRWPGLDIRADGGYALFCGRTDKGEYTWLRDPVPESLLILPNDLRKFLGLLHAPVPDSQPRIHHSNGYHDQGRVDSNKLLERALAQIGSEGRNNAGFWLAVQLRDNGYSQSEAERVLRDYRACCPDTNAKGQRELYTEHETLASLRQVYNASPREPWSLSTQSPSWRNGTATHQQPEDNRKPELSSEDPFFSEPTSIPRTELGNAERLVRDCDGDVRHCQLFKQWYIYDGARYCPDTTGEIMRRAKKTIRSIPLEAATQSRYAARLRKEASSPHLAPDQQKTILQKALSADRAAQKISDWAISSEKAACIKNTITLAQSEPGVCVQPSDLDADPWLFSVLNGVVDLRTGEMLPHSRVRLITKLAPVQYDPSAQCSKWLEFLQSVFPPPHDDIIPFLKRALGYSLTGSTKEECFFVLWGTGRNGKGTLIKTVSSILSDYAGTADFSTFVQRRLDDSGPREDIASMAGKRFIAAQESREGASFAESTIKNVTGGDIIRARRLHENGFEFLPTFKIWLATNHKPNIQGTDVGIWSRVRLIPFTVSFEGRENKTLKNDLLSEQSGILNWLIEGCLEWQKHGLGLPESVAQANQEYRSECDQLQRFLEDCCETGEYFTVGARELYLAYKKWCEQAGESFVTETAFGRRMAERGFKKERDSRGNRYQNVGFRADKRGADGNGDR